MDFWSRVDRLIKQENTSYAYIAKKLGKRESTVSGWHRSIKHKIPEADFTVIIAEILHTSVEYLVTGHEPAHISPKLSPEALEIARAADRLNDEGKRAALAVVEGLQKAYPLGASKSTGTAT